jgi:hypothetical protein
MISGVRGARDRVVGEMGGFVKSEPAVMSVTRSPKSRSPEGFPKTRGPERGAGGRRRVDR